MSIEVYGAGASGDATTTTSGESFEVTGLFGGVEYQFSVAARSSAGLGDRSEVVRVSTSSAKPDPPTATHQTASSITLSWSAPTVGTGEASTGYQVYLVTVAAGTTEPVYTLVYDGAGSEATSVELTSLDSGSLYTYVLSSLSAAGESDKSDAMSASTAPGVATGLSSTVQTTGSIALAWTAPTIPSGAAVTGYKVYSRVVHSQSSVSHVFAEAGVGADVVEHFLDPEDQSMVLDTLVYDGRNDVTTATDPSTELNGLQGGSLYTYLVGALSDAGESDRSASLAVSTAAPAPTGLVSVSQTTTGMELSWTAPEVTSGEAVTGYKVYRDDGAGGAVDVVAYDSRENSGDFVSTSCSVSGLTGGLTYTYEVSALSLAGESDRSSSMTSPTSPLQVSGVGSTSQTTGSITLSWSAPSATVGNEASGYMVYHNDGVGGSEMSTVGYDGSSSTSTSGTITGLVGGREYSFVVSALSHGGEGDVSDVLLQSTSPAAPTALASTVQTTTSISLSWTAPVTETGGAGVTGYVLYLSLIHI